MLTPARARAIPLATLVCTVAGLGLLRARQSWVASHSSRGRLAPVTTTSLGDASAASIARGPETSTAARGDADGGADDAGEASDGGNASVVAVWPRTLHGDSRRTARSPARGPSRAKVRWQTSIGGPVEAQVVTSPDERSLYVASLAGSLTALDADTGAKEWSLSLGDRAYSTPCVAMNGTIYVGSDAHRFYAVSPKGTVLWKLETSGEADTAGVIAANLVVFAAGSSVYAVRNGGDVAWRFDAKRKIFTAPAVAPSGAIVVGSQDHRVYSLSPLGALAWSVDLGADVDGAPAIDDDGAISVGTDGGEIVRLTASGEVRWRAQVGGFVRGALSLARNGDVLAGVYGPTPRVVRIGEDGTMLASFAVQGSGSREMGVHGGPLEDASGALFFGGQDDEVHALGPDGAWQWSFSTGGDVDAPLTLLSNGTLLAASDDGSVYSFDP